MPFYMVMNWKKWNSLPPDIQQVFTDLSGDYARKLFADYWWNVATIGAQKEFVKTGGTTYHWSQADITKVNELWKPVIEDWITKMEGKGYPARAIVQAFQQSQQKYSVPIPF